MLDIFKNNSIFAVLMLKIFNIYFDDKISSNEINTN